MGIVLPHLLDETVHGPVVLEIDTASGGEEVEKVRIAAVVLLGDLAESLSPFQGGVFRFELVPFLREGVLFADEGVGVEGFEFGTLEGVEFLSRQKFLYQGGVVHLLVSFSCDCGPAPPCSISSRILFRSEIPTLPTASSRSSADRCSALRNSGPESSSPSRSSPSMAPARSRTANLRL